MRESGYHHALSKSLMIYFLLQEKARRLNLEDLAQLSLSFFQSRHHRGAPSWRGMYQNSRGMILTNAYIHL